MKRPVPAVYKVEDDIPEIGAERGDVLVDCPREGLSIVREIPAAERFHVLSAHGHRLRRISPPGAPEKPPPLWITTPPVDGWQ